MALPLDQAVAAVVGACRTLGAERVPLEECAGRVLAAGVAAPGDLPRFDNSAMDGYAVRAADAAGAPVWLDVAHESRAGAPSHGRVDAGTATRVSTGAAMPGGADAVVRVEDTVPDGRRVRIDVAVEPGHDVRPAGDDVRAGQVVLGAGTVLGAGEVGMLAAVGVAEVQVVRRPRVAIVATGDELVPPGEPLGPGRIHDSNSYMLTALVEAAGGRVCTVVRGVGDTRQATDRAVAGALDGADLLVTLGGVSIGEHDHVKQSLRDAGVREVFWKVALRPGHPTWFGVRDGGDAPVPVLGLPGNPGSAYVTFHLFAAPALAALGGRAEGPTEFPATYRGPGQAKRPGMALALRVRLGAGPDGPEVEPTGENQRSHSMSALVGVDALALVDPSAEALEDGDRVTVRLVGG